MFKKLKAFYMENIDVIAASIATINGHVDVCAK